jgi:hypothetical protein
MEVAMKIEDRIAKDEAEVLKAVRAMIARGALSGVAECVTATMLRHNEMLADLAWKPGVKP